MNTVVLYYSYSGHSKKVAEKLARTQSAELVEIKTMVRRPMPLLFVYDCALALMHRAVAIQPITQELSAYDMITLVSPVWASNPAPAFNAAVKLLPKGKKVQVIMVSSSGSGATKRSEKATKHRIREQGCTVVEYKDVKQPE
jgi:flavodoxin